MTRHAPTHLTDFLACRHLTALGRLVTAGHAKRPYYDDPMREVLVERGQAHERAYVEHLRVSGFDVAPAEGGFQVLVPANDGRTTGLTYRRIGG